MPDESFADRTASKARTLVAVAGGLGGVAVYASEWLRQQPLLLIVVWGVGGAIGGWLVGYGQGLERGLAEKPKKDKQPAP